MAQKPNITLTFSGGFFLRRRRWGGGGGTSSSYWKQEELKIQKYSFDNLQSSINTLMKGFPEKLAATISARPCIQLSHQLEKISTAMPPFSQRLLLSRSISPWSCHRELWRNSSGLTTTFHAYPCGGRGSETVNGLSDRMKTSFLWLTRCSHIGKPKCGACFCWFFVYLFVLI